MDAQGELSNHYSTQEQDNPVWVPGVIGNAVKLMSTTPKLLVTWFPSTLCPMNITSCDFSGLSLSFWMKFSDLLPGTWGWTEMFDFKVDGFHLNAYRSLHEPTYTRFAAYAKDRHNTSSTWWLPIYLYPDKWYMISASWSRETGLVIYENENVHTRSPTSSDQIPSGSLETKFAPQGRNWTMFDEFYLWAEAKPASFFKRLYYYNKP